MSKLKIQDRFKGQISNNKTFVLVFIISALGLF